MCDCCDGTDEHDGGARCPNTCLALGASRRDEIRARVHNARGGVDARRKILEGAPALRRRWQDESAKLEKDVAAQRDIVRDASVAKEAAEAEEKKATEAEDRLNKREASKNKGDDDGSGNDTAVADTAVADEVPTPTPTSTETVDEYPVIEDDVVPESQAIDDDVAGEREETEEERGRRIAQQWIHGDSESTGTAPSGAEPASPTDADLSPEERKRRDMDRLIAEAARNQAMKESGGIPAGAYEETASDDVPDPEPATSMGEARGGAEGAEGTEGAEEDGEEEDGSGGGGGFFSSLFGGKSGKSGKSGKAIRDRATRAKKAANDKRDAHARAQRTLTELEGKHKDVTTRLSTFFGPNMELAHMAGECYKLAVEQYAYEV